MLRGHTPSRLARSSRLIVLCVSCLLQKYFLSLKFPSHAMPSAQTDVVSARLFQIESYLTQLLDVAVSLNSNDAQIYSRVGSEWKVTETLAEVRPPPFSSIHATC